MEALPIHSRGSTENAIINGEKNAAGASVAWVQDSRRLPLDKPHQSSHVVLPDADKGSPWWQPVWTRGEIFDHIVELQGKSASAAVDQLAVAIPSSLMRIYRTYQRKQTETSNPAAFGTGEESSSSH
jgi:hypothetical protein